MWWDDDEKLRDTSLLFIPLINGEETHPLGFVGLHLTKVDLSQFVHEKE